MPDQILQMTTASPPALEDRLSAVAGRIQSTLISLPRFRPADPDLARQFDALTTDLLTSLVEITAAAAVDEAAIILAKDLSAQRKEVALASQKLRDQTDIAMAGQTIPFPKAVG